MANELVFAPLGGLGEIGMNLSIYGFGDGRRRQWIMIDCGVSFASEEHLPGVDLILPDISYLLEERKNILGLVLTHAHEDHMGAIMDLWPRLKVPFYATPFSAALFEARRASEPGAPEIPVNVVPVGRPPLARAVRDRFHQCLAFDSGIECAGDPHAGRHRRAYRRLEDRSRRRSSAARRMRQSSPRWAMPACWRWSAIPPMPSATASRRRKPMWPKTLAELIRTAPRRVAVTTFASHVGRLRAVADAARAAEREVVVVGRAMERVVQVARETGYLDGVQDFRSAESYGYLPPDKVLALCTGSQGEPRAALSRIAEDEHPEVTLSRGDRVIFSARPIPGNEKAISRVINGLVEQGVEVITDRTHLVHVSGHPRREELREMIGWVRPKILIPAHGEALHLAEHADFARKAGVPHVLVCRNGDLVRLCRGRPRHHRRGSRPAGSTRTARCW